MTEAACCWRKISGMPPGCWTSSLDGRGSRVKVFSSGGTGPVYGSVGKVL